MIKTFNGNQDKRKFERKRKIISLISKIVPKRAGKFIKF